MESDRANGHGTAVSAALGAEALLEAERQMVQVRELLFGEFARQMEARLARTEARIGEIEEGLGQRLDALHARLDAFAEQVDVDRRGVLEELSHGVGDLAERVRAIARLRTELGASGDHDMR